MFKLLLATINRTSLLRLPQLFSKVNLSLALVNTMRPPGVKVPDPKVYNVVSVLSLSWTPDS